MSLPCYACGQPADYSCVATDSDHQMCQEHSVESMTGFVEPLPNGEIEAPDRQYYCLDHADLELVKHNNVHRFKGRRKEAVNARSMGLQSACSQDKAAGETGSVPAPCARRALGALSRLI